MLRFITSAFLAAVILLSPLSYAADLGPDEIVRQVTADVLESVQKDKQLQAYFMAREFDDGGKQLMAE